MKTSSTIIVRHIPTEIDDEHKIDFLKHFGAQHVKLLTSKANKRCIAYARFESEEIAEAVVQQLHQKELLGRRLTVELSPTDLDVNLMVCPKPLPKIDNNGDEFKKLQEAYLKKLNSWSSGINMDLPPPHHLRYSYPDPNPHILANIAYTLSINKKFYYQVLHLMNRMNLPTPFDPVEEVRPHIFQKVETIDNYTTMYETDPELSESEMESEDEESKNKVGNQPIQLKRPKSKFFKPKRLKVVSGIIPKKPKLEVSHVFDKVDYEKQKKIEVKVSAELKPIEGPPADTEGFGIIYSLKNKTKEEEIKENLSDDDISGGCISKEELANNRLSSKDIKILPVFKNYHPGAPSCRLYVKNLAKTVTTDDLKFIYKRFISLKELQPGTMFDVRLMQEGRMKGQAFITMPCVQNASQALEETNGYILKDKPMVVQFARSATVK
ncbi:RNA-binding region-containing protein 3-like [Daktulosphaira vitifoliae]|uniref:RNA-binding region-containing protein 3-like n=1 Tax=Daktulosphaira vitifoliae TaxID=58002 RepID=UPI0021AA3DFF|nr:RNA-binding region-containing protein 3-like [Daktulosphaira vitifoliae]